MSLTIELRLRAIEASLRAQTEERRARTTGYTERSTVAHNATSSTWRAAEPTISSDERRATQCTPTHRGAHRVQARLSTCGSATRRRLKRIHARLPAASDTRRRGPYAPVVRKGQGQQFALRTGRGYSHHDPKIIGDLPHRAARLDEAKHLPLKLVWLPLPNTARLDGHVSQSQ